MQDSDRYQSPQLILKSRMKCLKKEQDYNEVKQGYKRGHWTPEEHRKYMIFWDSHESESHDRNRNKRSLKIFKRMSKVIITRSPSQCRSHHQKFNPQAKAKCMSDSDILNQTDFSSEKKFNAQSNRALQYQDQAVQTNFDIKYSIPDQLALFAAETSVGQGEPISPYELISKRDFEPFSVFCHQQKYDSYNVFYHDR